MAPVLGRRGAADLLLIVLLAATCGCGGGKQQKGSSIKEELASAMKLTDFELRAKKLLNIAQRQAAEGHETGAMDTLDKAAGSAERIEAAAPKADVLLRIFKLQAELGGALAGKSRLKMAEQQFEHVAPAERVPLLIAAARAYLKHLDKPASAKLLLTSASESLESISDFLDHNRAELELAAAWSLAGESAASQEMLQAALDAARGQTDARLRSDSLAQAAPIIREMGDGSQTTAVLDEAEQAAAAIEDPLSRGNALIALGRHAREAQLHDRSKAFFAKASEAAGLVDDLNMRKSLMDNLTRARN